MSDNHFCITTYSCDTDSLVQIKMKKKHNITPKPNKTTKTQRAGFLNKNWLFNPVKTCTMQHTNLWICQQYQLLWRDETLQVPHLVYGNMDTRQSSTTVAKWSCVDGLLSIHARLLWCVCCSRSFMWFTSGFWIRTSPSIKLPETNKSNIINQKSKTTVTTTNTLYCCSWKSTMSHSATHQIFQSMQTSMN